MGLLITLAGIPIYYVCIAWEQKPARFEAILDKATQMCQKLFMSAHEDAGEASSSSDEEEDEVEEGQKNAEVVAEHRH